MISLPWLVVQTVVTGRLPDQLRCRSLVVFLVADVVAFHHRKTTVPDQRHDHAVIDPSPLHIADSRPAQIVEGLANVLGTLGLATAQLPALPFTFGLLQGRVCSIGFWQRRQR
jgi:hypothetical protein